MGLMQSRLFASRTVKSILFELDRTASAPARCFSAFKFFDGFYCTIRMGKEHIYKIMVYHCVQIEALFSLYETYKPVFYSSQFHWLLKPYISFSSKEEDYRRVRQFKVSQALPSACWQIAWRVQVSIILCSIYASDLFEGPLLQWVLMH